MEDDAKKHALLEYPNDEEGGVALFLRDLGISEGYFIYKFNQTPAHYIYGGDE